MSQNIVLTLDTTPPNLIMSPASGSSGVVPFTIYFTSDDPATVYYRADGGTPTIGGPGTNVAYTPFQITITELGTHNISYIAIDDVGNVSEVQSVTYDTQGGYSILGVHPTVVSTVGGETVKITGRNFNFGASVLINGELVPTSYIGSTELTAKTLPLAEGIYHVQVNDPVNGPSILLLNAITFLEPEDEVTVSDPPYEVGETRKHLFETDQGPMLLESTLVENYDYDTIVQSQAEELGLTLQMEQNFDAYPAQIETE